MGSSLDLGARKILFCCAHPSEAKALPAGLPCLVTGVGKVPAAVSLSRRLALAPRGSVQGVLIFGVAGVYPDQNAHFDPNLPVGQTVWVTRDRLIDEGVLVGEGFLDLDALNLRGPTPAVYEADAAWMQKMRKAGPWPELGGATVSTCSGTDALSLQRARQGSAQIETMEGAAYAHCCLEHQIPWVQLRVISNRCGEREGAGWDLPLSLSKLAGSLNELFA